MSDTKITRKDLFMRIADVMCDDEEVVAMCDKYIAQLSVRRAAKAKPEVEEFRRAVLVMLEAQEEPITNKQMCELWREQGGEVSAQKMAAALRWLVANGYATRQDPESKNDSATYLAADHYNGEVDAVA